MFVSRYQQTGKDHGDLPGEDLKKDYVLQFRENDYDDSPKMVQDAWVFVMTVLMPSSNKNYFVAPSRTNRVAYKKLVDATTVADEALLVWWLKYGLSRWKLCRDNNIDDSDKVSGSGASSAGAPIPTDTSTVATVSDTKPGELTTLKIKRKGRKAIGEKHLASEFASEYAELHKAIAKSRASKEKSETWEVPLKAEFDRLYEKQCGKRGNHDNSSFDEIESLLDSKEIVPTTRKEYKDVTNKNKKRRSLVRLPSANTYCVPLMDAEIRVQDQDVLAEATNRAVI